MKYRTIQGCREAYPIRMMCDLLGVSRSGYYDWSTRTPSKRSKENARLLQQIRAIHSESDGRKGANRIWDDLLDGEIACGENRVARLMREDGLKGIPHKRRRGSKRPGARPFDVSNLLARNFKASEPNEKWVTDITQIETREGWLFLCIVLDLFSDVVVGWSMSRRQDHALVIRAVSAALWHRDGGTSTILHSDRGCQFTSDAYQRFLKDQNIVSSMSRVGSCADNAAAEGFFGRLKRERVNRRRYFTVSSARADVFDYIERVHNPTKRRKQERLRPREILLT